MLRQGLPSALGRNSATAAGTADFPISRRATVVRRSRPAATAAGRATGVWPRFGAKTPANALPSNIPLARMRYRYGLIGKIRRSCRVSRAVADRASGDKLWTAPDRPTCSRAALGQSFPGQRPGCLASSSAPSAGRLRSLTLESAEAVDSTWALSGRFDFNGT